MTVPAGVYGPNYSPNGAPGSAGDNETRVDRPNEGLSGEQTTTINPSGANPTRGNFDTYHAIGYVSKQVAQIDTSGITQTVWRSLQNAAPLSQNIAPQNYTAPGVATYTEAPVNN